MMKTFNFLLAISLVCFAGSTAKAAGLHYVTGKVRSIDRKKVVFQTQRVRFTLLRSRLLPQTQKQLESPKAQKVPFKLTVPVHAIVKSELIY